MAVASVGPFTNSAEPVISENGNLVAFTALVGLTRQVFLRDLSAGTTALVSANPAPGDADSESPAMTPDGTMVAFASRSGNLGGFLDPQGYSDVFVATLTAATMTQVSISTDGLANGDGDSREPSLSPDGTFIAYISEARNVAENDPDRADGDANGLANLIIAPQ